MADKDDEDKKEGTEGEAPAEGDAAAPKKKGSPLAGIMAALPVPEKLKLPVLIAIPILLVGLIVLGLVLSGVLGPKKAPKKDCDPAHAEECSQAEGEGDAADAGKDGDKPKEGEKTAYYNMPDILVNLDSRGRKASVLKMAVTLELGSAEDVKAMEDKLPKITDEFQVFLREVRIEDLRGSAGIYRLRQELLMRIKPAVAPIKVKDVLFKELLIQ